MAREVAEHVAGIIADFLAVFAAVAGFSLGAAGVDRSKVGIFPDSGAGAASPGSADIVAVFAGDVAGIVAGDLAACDMVELIAVFAAISM